MARERDSSATRARLLDAATREFAAYGIAGARVDRIATAADANKQLIYAYFTNKEGLFDAVLGQEFAALTEGVSFDTQDLPGYVGRLFDYVVQRPEVLRLATWAGLERPTAVAEFEAEPYRAKLDALAAAQRDGTVTDAFAPADLIALLLAVAAAWFNASEALRTLAADDPWTPERLAQFRAAAVEAGARLTQPPTTALDR
jgi:AcrR family transcriptional regulator